MLATPLCGTLGIEVPIFNAPTGGATAGAELAAAVANAGGFGMLGLTALPPPFVRELVRRTRALTRRPFGANVILVQLQGGEIDVLFDEQVAVLSTHWGNPGPLVRDAHRRGVKVIPQVGSVEEAVACAEAGVDAIVAQGVEAGGHVRGTVSLAVLVPAVVEAVRPIPVIAAGGIADGRGVAAALALGAGGVMMGTRFLATPEAGISPAYKERIVRSRAEDTILTGLFDVGWPDAPHRVLRNRAVTEWEAAGRPESGRRPGEGQIVGRAAIGGHPLDVVRYSLVPPVQGYEGDLELACLYAGESCTLVRDVRPAGDIVRDVARDAEAILRAAVREAR